MEAPAKENLAKNACEEIVNRRVTIRNYYIQIPQISKYALIFNYYLCYY